MDGMAVYELGKVLYEDMLREAAARERLYLSARFRKLGIGARREATLSRSSTDGAFPRFCGVSSEP